MFKYGESMDVQERQFLERCIGKKMKVIQKDGFTKFGLCQGYSESSLFLLFDDGSEVALALSDLIEKRIIGDVKDE